MKDIQPFYIPGATQWKMESKRGAIYRIMAWIPEGEAPPDGFPIYYVLDANAVFGTFTETMRVQSKGPRRQEPAIIVGIGYDSEAPIVTERRFLDFTLPAADHEMPPPKNNKAWPANGGVEVFLDFIEQELKPSIEKMTKVNQQRQALFGHSLGGFLVLYTLCTRPKLFQYYAAGSPSVWWKNSVIFEYAKRFIAKEAQYSTSAKRLFVGVGSEEREHMVNGGEQIYQMFASDQSTVRAKFSCFEGENHISVLLPFISQVIRDFRDQASDQPKTSSFLL